MGLVSLRDLSMGSGYRLHPWLLGCRPDGLAITYNHASLQSPHLFLWLVARNGVPLTEPAANLPEPSPQDEIRGESASLALACRPQCRSFASPCCRPTQTKSA